MWPVYCLAISLLASGALAQGLRPQQDLQSIITGLGLQKFLEYVRTFEMGINLRMPYDLTLLAPTDKAFEEFEKKYFSSASNASRLSREQTKDLVHYHMLDHEWHASSWTNEQLLPTMRQGLNVRVNKHKTSTGEEVTTLNGVRMLQSDEHAANGIVHVLSSVMYPLPETNSIDTLLERQLGSQFLQFVKEAHLMKSIKYVEPLTIFVPTDESFARLPKGFIEKLTENMAATAVVTHHIVNGTFHVEALKHRKHLRTLEGGLLHISQTGNSDSDDVSIIINDSVKIVDSIATTTGVIHVVDFLLMPTGDPKHYYYGEKPQHDLRKKRK